MLYPFLLTIMEFNSDSRLDEISVIVLPDSFQDVFIDLQFYQVLASLLTAGGVSSQVKIKAARICARLPAVRKSISHDPEVIDRHICFCLNSFDVILQADFVEEDEDRIDQLIDLTQRLFRTYSFDELQKDNMLPTSRRFLTNLGKLIVFSMESYFRVGSSRSESICEVMNQILTQTVKKEDEFLGDILMQAIKKYIESFFCDTKEMRGLDDSTLALTDPKEIKINIEGSIKAFEECYHYLEAVKQYIIEQFAHRFIKELSVELS